MKNSVLKWLCKVTGKKKIYVGILALIQGLYGGTGVLYALLLRNIVDSAVNRNKNKFYYNVIMMIILVSGQIIIRYIIRYLEEKARSSMENQFKSRLLENLFYKDYASVSAIHSGEWINRLTNDCMIVANNFTEIFPGIMGMSVKLSSAGIMIIALDIRFSMIIIPSGLAMILLTYAFRKKLKKLHKNVQEKDGSLRICFQEKLSSLMIIRLFSAEEHTLSEAYEKMNKHHSARMKKNHFSNLCNLFFQSGMQGMYLLGVCYCSYGILKGIITYGTMTAVIQLISQIQSPFANITGYLPKFYTMTASAERLIEIEKYQNDCEYPPKSIEEIQKFYKNDFSEISMKNIVFTYYPLSEKAENPNKKIMPVVLENISVDIKKGEYVAFTGYSGCGKSTVLKLLMCIYKQDSGERFITDIYGNKQNIDASWHRLYAYVPQGNQLMSGTIREIVAFADISQINNDEKIYNALKIACADEFVYKLENGIDTLLGERGTGLSEGQMQRIAIARAIFSDSPVLILDESTSALDEITEKNLLKNLRNMTDKTVLIVTHRPEALKICDIIFHVTEKGIVKKEIL